MAYFPSECGKETNPCLLKQKHKAAILLHKLHILLCGWKVSVTSTMRAPTSVRGWCAWSNFKALWNPWNFFRILFLFFFFRFHLSFKVLVGGGCLFVCFTVFLIFIRSLHVSNQMILAELAKQHIACRIEVVQKLLFGDKWQALKTHTYSPLSPPLCWCFEWPLSPSFCCLEVGRYICEVTYG